MVGLQKEVANCFQSPFPSSSSSSSSTSASAETLMPTNLKTLLSKKSSSTQHCTHSSSLALRSAEISSRLFFSAAAVMIVASNSLVCSSSLMFNARAANLTYLEGPRVRFFPAIGITFHEKVLWRKSCDNMPQVYLQSKFTCFAAKVAKQVYSVKFSVKI